jgi:hypothetical protein
VILATVAGARPLSEANYPGVVGRNATGRKRAVTLPAGSKSSPAFMANIAGLSGGGTGRRRGPTGLVGLMAAYGWLVGGLLVRGAVASVAFVTLRR